MRNGLLLFVLTITAVPAAYAATKKKKAAAPPADSMSADDTNAGGTDRSHFEAFLKDRVAKLSEAHKLRMGFFDTEKAGWEAFWIKIRDERRKFEIRITQQTLDLFESLASLDPKDREVTIANFDKLQSDLIKSFDQHQKQRMQGFFADHDSRWKEFAAEQDKERADFMADAQSGWQQNKESMEDQAAPPAKVKKNAPEDFKDADEPPPPPPPPAKKQKKAKKPELAPAPEPAADSDSDSDSDSGSKTSKDVWH
jgi:hypothetical protein